LRRLLGLRERIGPAFAPSSGISAQDRELEGAVFADGLRLHEHCVQWPLPEAASFAIDDGVERRYDRVMLFDTETTGLAGGTGTRAFMIGAADWQPGRLRVRQLTLTSMAGEAAMLREFARWLAPDTVLVSYNGRSYDAPLLATRYRLARLTNPLSGLAHLDLLHPVRRRYRGVWEYCRLATVERQLLGIVREDDLPGSEAPRAWRDYLRGGSARDLRRVGQHNAQDLRSLAGVLIRLGQVADSGLAVGANAGRGIAERQAFAARGRVLQRTEVGPRALYCLAFRSTRERQA
jgi:uncharacterized protein YprB with RNaseH-like and TPR domain